MITNLAVAEPYVDKEWIPTYAVVSEGANENLMYCFFRLFWMPLLNSASQPLVDTR